MKALLLLILAAFVILGAVSAYWVLKPIVIAAFIALGFLAAYLLGRFHKRKTLQRDQGDR